MAELVEEGQELHGGAMLRRVEDHIDAPYVVDPVGLDLRIRPRRVFGPHGRTEDLQAFTAPDPLHGPQRALQPKTAWMRR